MQRCAQPHLATLDDLKSLAGSCHHLKINFMVLCTPFFQIFTAIPPIHPQLTQARLAGVRIAFNPFFQALSILTIGWRDKYRSE